MINVGMYYNVKEGKEDEFERTFSSVVATLKEKAEGLRDAKLYREVSGREYLIYTEWKDMESFSKFISSREFGETKEYGKDIIDGRPRHRVFQDVGGEST